MSLSNLREYTLSIDEFGKPKILTDNDAICIKLIEIGMLEPGTYPDHPYMGLGIRSRYRYTTDADLENLKTDYKNQVETYLPELKIADLNIYYGENDLMIHINIQIDNVVYPLILNTEKKTLSSL